MRCRAGSHARRSARATLSGRTTRHYLPRSGHWIVREFACKWPAVSRWADLDALAARAAAHQDQDAALGRTAPLLVPVEVGHSYADGGVEKVQADFQELLRFVKRYWLAPPPSGTPNVYLAQTRLADVLPALAEDLGEPALVHECGRGTITAATCGLATPAREVTVTGTPTTTGWWPSSGPSRSCSLSAASAASLCTLGPRAQHLGRGRSAPDEARFPRFREARGCHATLADGGLVYPEEVVALLRKCSVGLHRSGFLVALTHFLLSSSTVHESTRPARAKLGRITCVAARVSCVVDS